MSSNIVEICTVNAVAPHPNADRLELAYVKGWQCVVPKGQYKEGDLCVYIPIDSVLPHNVEAIIFPEGSKVTLSKSRVKTIRLRGAISQGLMVSTELLSVANLPVGTDCSKFLGITKYEPPVSASPQRNLQQKSKKQCNPHFKKYTSIENFKNFNEVFAEGDKVVITEKIHGTNFRAGYVPTKANTLWKKILKFFRVLPEYEFVYGSHNVQLQDNPRPVYYSTDVYTETVNKYDLKSMLLEGEVIYGEVYGGTIQKGYHYGCDKDERKLVVFDLMVDGEYVEHARMESRCAFMKLPTVPVLFKGGFSASHAKLLSTGDSVLAPTQKVREGIVIKPVEETTCYMGRKILKLINDDYYLLKDTTDFH